MNKYMYSNDNRNTSGQTVKGTVFEAGYIPPGITRMMNGPQ